MSQKKKNNLLPLLIILISLLILPLIACPMYTAVAFEYEESNESGADGQVPGDNPDGIEVTDENVTLAWDSPSEEVDFYRLSFRIHGANPPDSVAWYIIDDNISADPNPEYQVNRVGSGPFDFGVVANYLNSGIEESALHSSLDITAEPDTGWYLIWFEP